jgi:hypothetical protein
MTESVQKSLIYFVDRSSEVFICTIVPGREKKKKNNNIRERPKYESTQVAPGTGFSFSSSFSISLYDVKAVKEVLFVYAPCLCGSFFPGEMGPGAI